jgi:peptidase C25-like protein/flagellar hook capping protein FlgD
MAAGLTLAALAVGAGAARAAPPAVRLSSASTTEIRFVVDVPELVREQAPGGTEVVLSLSGYTSVGDQGEPGIPQRVVCVAVPPTGAVTVLAAGSGEQRFDSVRVAARGGDGPGPLRLAEDGASDAAAGRALYGAGVARLVDVSWLRNQRVARIAVTPVRYDAAAHVATAQRAVEIRVQVEAPPAVAPSSPTSRPARDGADPFEAVYREALVNYEQGIAWRGSRSTVNAGGARVARSFTSRDLELAPDSIVLVGRRWVKIGIPATGFYRLRYGQFRRFAPFSDDTSTRLEDVRLITMPGMPVLPESSYCDTCEYRQVALGLVDNGDGRLNRSDDAVYFYALGPSDWEDVFDPSRPDTNYLNHPYETRNYYYLGIDASGSSAPKRITTRSAAVQVDGDEITPTTFPARVHKEIEAAYLPNNPPPTNSTYTWDKWFWTTLHPPATFITTVDAPGADTTQQALVRTRLTSFEPDLACAEIFRTQFMDLTWNGAASQRMGWKGYVPWTAKLTVPTVRPRGNDFSARAELNRCNNDIGVSWVELYYAHRFEPQADRLDFRSFDVGPLLYRIEPFVGATRPRVFDVSDPRQPIELLQFDWQQVAGGWRLSFEAPQTEPRRYRIERDSSMTDVPAANITATPATSLIDLKSGALRADYLVIYYDEFQAAADTLAAWRHAHQGFEVMTIPISALYDQFSGGRTDPAAIRNFLRATFQRWDKTPGFVQFIGDASYDFKNLTGHAPVGKPPVLLPTYEGGFDRYVLRQFTTDDWLLNVDNALVVVPDFLGGRIPAMDATSAMDIVRNKILFYERSAPLGDYRNRIMLIADDQEQGSKCDPLTWTHLVQTDSIGREHLPAHIDRDYIYLHTYPGEDTKPGAKADILDHVNGIGVAVVNYVGHGSPFKLADESVLQTGDLGALHNADRLPAFIAASCDVGKFSDPVNESLGELLVRRTGGGAIAVISSTELAFSNQNGKLDATIYDRVFDRSPTGKYHYTLSEALLLGKLAGDTNSQKYQLMGDAATRLNLPELWVELSLFPESSPDTTVATDSTLVQGSLYRFSGRVVDHPGGDLVPVDGIANLLVEDSAPTLLSPLCVLPQCLSCAPAFYRYRAGAIFRGDIGVRAGRLEGRFMVPVEARPGPDARIRAYLTGGAIAAPGVDGAGARRLAVAVGKAPAGDTHGPEIRLSFPNGATTVRPDAVLRVDLSDPSGILITGHTAQNGILVTVDDNSTTREDITDTFRYAANSYQSGSATFRLNETMKLAEGPHRITVSAADNLASGFAAVQHRSTASIEFEVAAQPPLQILSAYLFPNPTSSRGGSSGGWFVVDTQGDALNVLLRIYTSSGRLVRALTVRDARGQIQVPWDGLDAEGQALANGLYLFKVHLNPLGADGLSDPTQNAESEGRFVIVNP